jgi:dTDP-4-amino-4,6-dideoxygalactose transaminase
MNVPFVDLRAQNSQVKNQILEMWSEILDTAGFVGGKYVKQFEDNFAKMCNTKHCIAVSSGTDALIAGLWALGVKPKDEVIVPANTFIATIEAVQNLGAIPILVDCEPENWNIDASQVKKVITEKTVGIIGVHLYGQPCDMEWLEGICKENNIWLMEDSAQGHLATLDDGVCGSLGNCAAFSFYPGKNLGATGEGGAVTTNDDTIAERVRMYISHGSKKKYFHVTHGTNARMSAVIAAGLCAKLEKIESWTESRRTLAKKYLAKITNPEIQTPIIMNGANPVWHLFVVHTKNRSRLAEYLNEKNVSTGMHYPVPIHLQEQFGDAYSKGDFPNAEYNAEHCLSLPMFETMSDEQLLYVVDALNEYTSED